MRKNKAILRTHTDMRGFGYLMYFAFSLILTVVMLFLPLAPIFASEEVTQEMETTREAQPEVQEESQDVHREPTDVIPDGESVVVHGVSEMDNELNIEASITDEEEDDVEEGNELADIQVDPLIDGDSLETPETGIESATSTADNYNDDLEGVLAKENSNEDEIFESEINEGHEQSEGTTSPHGGEFSGESDEEENVDEEGFEDESFGPDPEQATVVTASLVNDENRFSFSKDECTSVGDGTFYCTKSGSELLTVHTDRIFAAPDADGDKEIYIEKNSEIIQITHNLLDDDAPYYDDLSDTFVWQRLIDGRYQIISFDIEENLETQITFDRYNNMQPNKYGDTLVWQGWLGNDWEIFMLKDDEFSMLTDNTIHDITPSVSGDHIVWQSFEENAWKMKVYDMRTKRIDTIGDAEGGSVENPRFVLVYDTKFESGDIETRGYDLQSGETVSLSVEPVPLPEEIPDPEQTGEERALVTPTSQPRSKTNEVGDSNDMGTSTPPIDDDLVILPSESDETITGPDDVATTTNDLIVPPLVATSTDHVPDEVLSSPDDVIIAMDLDKIEPLVEHIPDVIVAPFADQNETIQDSQLDVASST